MLKGLRFGSMTGAGLILSGALALASCNDDDEATATGGAGGSGGSGDTGGQTTGGDGGGGETLEPRFVELGEVVEAELAAKGIHGAAVAYVEDGKVAFVRGYGQRGRYLEEPVDADTLFNIGSMSKSITATAVLSAIADDPNTSLDTPLVDLVPALDYPPAATLPLMTLDMALSHTAALGNWGGSGHSTSENIQDEASDLVVTYYLPELADSGVDQWTLPGHAFQYSNPGYSVAGLSGETITGSFYADYMRERVANPLGMTRTFARSAEVEEAGNYTHGDGVNFGFDAPVEASDIDAAWFRPAGLVWSSARDMARFVEFQLNGDPAVLSDQDRLAMQAPRTDTELCYDYPSYGHGLYSTPDFWLFVYHDDPDLHSRYHDVPTVWHDGYMPGYVSLMVWLPEQKAGYVVLWNSSDELLWSTMDYIHEKLLPLPPAVEAPDISGKLEDWQAFNGTYFEPLDFGTLNLTADATGVHIEMPDSPFPYSDELVPVCRNTFVFSAGDVAAYLTLLEDPDGGPNLIRLNGYNYTFDRVVDPANVPALAPASIRKERLVRAAREQPRHALGIPRALRTGSAVANQ